MSQPESSLLIDAHTHLQDPMIWENLDPVSFTDRCRSSRVCGAVVCGCHPGDWSSVQALQEKLNPSDFQIFPQCGLHPWWVKDRPSDWMENLKKFLVHNPEAGVGEVGLDAHFPDLANLEEQIAVCEQQLLLAWELDRPVTVHCLKAHNEFLGILKRYLPRPRKASENGTRLQQERKHAEHLADLTTVPIVLHMFTGSEEYVKAYCKFSENIFFSVFSKGPKDSLIKAIPIERLVVETDSPFQPAREEEKEGVLKKSENSVCCIPPGLCSDSDGKRVINDPSQLPLSVQRIANAKGLSFDEVARTTRENTIRAFRLRKIIRG